MIEYPDGGRLVESYDELPNITRVHDLFADWETTSGDPKESSVNPWHHCSPCGLAITFDDEPRAWYVPARFLSHEWLRRIRCDRWINHNIKYDAHVMQNAFGFTFPGNWLCTIVLAKLAYSDFMNYSLDQLTSRWVPHARKRGDLLAPYYKQSKDFGDVPLVVQGEYACGDVLSNRILFKYIDSRIPAESHAIRDIEIKLTKRLWQMEQRGVKCEQQAARPFTDTLPEDIRDKVKCDMTLLEAVWCARILRKVEALNAELVAANVWDEHELFEPHNTNHCRRLLIEGLGLPALRWNSDQYGNVTNPSFDKNVLTEYKSLAGAPVDIIEAIEDCRADWTINNLFVESYANLNVDGVLHGNFNQIVRTGRMSMSQPNMQQLNKAAKRFIVPRDGKAFLSFDYSQIEFRLIVHFINNARCIADYHENPDTDFHTWVANMCNIPRKPAKNVNFMLGYGGGKKKTVAMLMASKELIANLNVSPEGYRLAVRQLAEETYRSYHDTLPELKRCSKQAERIVKSRALREPVPESEGKEFKDRPGYARTLLGRRRYMPSWRGYIGFNTVSQGSAADIMKERLVALCEMLEAEYPYVEPLLVVHDEVLSEIPAECDDPRVPQAIQSLLETPPKPLRVPLRAKPGCVTTESWAAVGD